eukprot:772410-Karenia_brevis.AAC.1
MIGTFSVGSAGFWWAHLGGAVGRVVWSLMLDDDFGIFPFVEEFAFRCSGSNMLLKLCLSLFSLEMVGTPVAWNKVSGGLQYEWIGYWQDLQRYQVGVSASRTLWLKLWIKDMLETPVILVRKFREGLGRLGYSRGPFLPSELSSVRSTHGHLRSQVDLVSSCL